MEKMSDLVDAQWGFLKDVATLIQFIESEGDVATAGELQRTAYQQKEYLRTGRSKTMNSLHLSKLAIDLAIFHSGIWLQDRDSLMKYGAFWQGLHEDNEWGGSWISFQDLPHFQRRLPK
jgi:peptidoglycan L-alanyl-D-glutamate endopeptidase CwlK